MFQLLFDQNIIYSNSLKNLILPKRLFKYNSTNEHSIQSLIDGNIKLSSPLNFDNPYDSQIGFFLDEYRNMIEQQNVAELIKFAKHHGSLNEEEINVLKKEENIKAAILKSLVSKYPGRCHFYETEFAKKITLMNEALDEKIQRLKNHKANRNSKVACFSESNNSVLMWSHHASYHTGFCVEYNFQQWPDQYVGKKNLYPVNYTRSLINKANFFLEEDINPQTWLLASLCKHTDWSYEKEWRLSIMDCSDETHRVPRPTAIYFGTRFDLGKLRPVISYAQNHNIPMFKMQMSISRFELSPVAFG